MTSSAPSPKRELPASKVARQRLPRQSEDDSGVLLIEQYIYRRDKYRSTSLDFPLPAPLVPSPLRPADLARWTADTNIMRDIGRVLHSHDIMPSMRIEAHNMIKPGYPRDGDKPRPTLLIPVDDGDTNPKQRWSAARRDLVDLLEKRGFTEFMVEIYDPNRYYRPSLFPIKPKHPAVAHYESVRDTLLRIVMERLQSKWQLLSLFMTGRDSSLARPSLVLMVSPLASSDWQTLVFDLERIINKDRSVDKWISTEIMPGACGRKPLERQELPGESFKADMDSHPRMGTSIGVGGEAGGTLGGYFKLECLGNTDHGFLTSSHVVAPAQSQPELARGTDIHYFAAKDVQETRDDIETDIASLTRALVTTTDQDRRALIQERLRVLNSRLSITQSMPLPIGKTIAASDRSLTPNGGTLDWAFVESPTFGKGRANNLPTEDRFADLEPNVYGDMNALVLPTKLQGLSGIQKGRWYFKCGRGLTAGICNGTEAYIVATEDRYSKELVIINAKGGKKSQFYQEPFCQNGDCGSLLVDAAGNAAGLLWGEVIGCCGPVINTSTRETAGGRYANAGLVTGIQDVVKAIGDNDPRSGKLSILS